MGEKMIIAASRVRVQVSAFSAQKSEELRATTAGLDEVPDDEHVRSLSVRLVAAMAAGGQLIWKDPVSRTA